MGSSPRVRGSPARELEEEVRLGIIPAGAGLTSIETRTDADGRDHPRGCGAHAAFTAAINSFSGSSPRVRGSRCMYLTASRAHGIIPAGAGLTLPSSWSDVDDWDHPRGCGAHCLRIFRVGIL